MVARLSSSTSMFLNPRTSFRKIDFVFYAMTVSPRHHLPSRRRAPSWLVGGAGSFLFLRARRQG
jgi:hypothetical protein